MIIDIIVSDGNRNKFVQNNEKHIIQTMKMFSWYIEGETRDVLKTIKRLFPNKDVYYLDEENDYNPCFILNN